MSFHVKAEIYYPSLNNIPENFAINLFLMPNITMDDFNKYYIKVCSVDIPNNVDLTVEKSINEFLESLFELFNSENNPLTNKKMQKHIIKNKLHTSMSMGDVIKIMDMYYYVANFGFKTIS